MQCAMLNNFCKSVSILAEIVLNSHSEIKYFRNELRDIFEHIGIFTELKSP